MRLSLPISVGLHTAILLSAALALPEPEEFEVTEQESVPVNVVTYEEYQQMRAQSETAEEVVEAAPEPVTETEVQEERPPEPEAEPAPEPEPVAALPEPVPEPVPPEPEPEPVPEVEPEPEPELIDEAAYPLPQQKPTPPPRVEPEETVLDLDRIAALLDKSEEEDRAAPPPETTDSGQQDQADEANFTGTDVALTGDERDAFIRQIERCWNPVIGVVGADSLLVRMRIYLTQNGAVDGELEVLNTEGTSQFRAASERARRAVLQCQPYDMPAEKYDAWQEIILNFDPRFMAEG